MSTVSDLREVLFSQLEALKDPEKDLHTEVARARAMSDIARTVLESAKVEADYMRASGAEIASSFIPTSDSNRLANTAAPEIRHLTATGVAVTQGNRTVHKIK
jgi:hypothetical protein